jgi:hypothetical protein
MRANDTDAPMEVLTRWEHHGATWRAVHVSDAKAIVDLCTCHGEAVQRMQSDDPELIRLLRERAVLDPK